ncbi:hypothetical protein D3C74_247960 [compost metagenome]
MAKSNTDLTDVFGEDATNLSLLVGVHRDRIDEFGEKIGQEFTTDGCGWRVWSEPAEYWENDGVALLGSVDGLGVAEAQALLDDIVEVESKGEAPVYLVESREGFVVFVTPAIYAESPTVGIKLALVRSLQPFLVVTA